MSAENLIEVARNERLFKAMLLIRRTEERIAEVYPTDCIKSPVHLSIGQEAIAVGVCDVLRTTDVAAMSYRGHAVYLAKGGDLRSMMAELYGKVTGCARGKGGSMHLVAPRQECWARRRWSGRRFQSRPDGRWRRASARQAKS